MSILEGPVLRRRLNVLSVALMLLFVARTARAVDEVKLALSESILVETYREMVSAVRAIGDQGLTAVLHHIRDAMNAGWNSTGPADRVWRIAPVESLGFIAPVGQVLSHRFGVHQPSVIAVSLLRDADGNLAAIRALQWADSPASDWSNPRQQIVIRLGDQAASILHSSEPYPAQVSATPDGCIVAAPSRPPADKVPKTTYAQRARLAAYGDFAAHTSATIAPDPPPAWGGKAGVAEPMSQRSGRRPQAGRLRLVDSRKQN